MYKYVDGCESFDGWAFVDEDCVEFHVTIPENVGCDTDVVHVGNDCDEGFNLYVSDIPMMIKALQAAYEYEG